MHAGSTGAKKTSQSNLGIWADCRSHLSAPVVPNKGLKTNLRNRMEHDTTLRRQKGRIPAAR
jgi:hypothetical protein